MIDFNNLDHEFDGLEFNAVVEIPKDCTQKYEFDHDKGCFVLDRPLYTSVHYPGEYGFVPKTLAEDGDPLDVLVKIDKPTFPGCVIRCRPIGVLKIIDKGDPDHKILAVPVNDPRSKKLNDIEDISDHYADEIDHFFSVYKDLEDKEISTKGWKGKEEALQIIRECVERHKEIENG